MEVDEQQPKQQHQSLLSSSVGQMETNLFAPCRALGLFCSSVPPVFVPPAVRLNSDQKHQGHIYCALDNQICVYSVQPLRLTWASQFESEISLLAADSRYAYAAFGTFVCITRESTVAHRLVIPNGGAKLLLSLTDLLVVVDQRDGINVFDVEGGKPVLELDSPASFRITALMHPDTYLNKILVGSADGRMRLWNLKSGRLVHEFPSDGQHFCSSIRVLEQSTSLDVVGVGMADGQIHLRNVKFDRILCTFRQQGQIAALAFRSDGVDTLASANSEGAIAIWDLNERMLVGQLARAHGGPITWLHFLLGQPLLLSAGEDNKMAKWFFRNESAVPELCGQLQGHSAPVTALKFSDEHLIVSASRDGHLRSFNTRSLNLARDFGLAREVRRGDLGKDRFMDVPLEAILDMQLGHGREHVWDNILCRHEHSPLVSTWSSRHARRGNHLLFHERFALRPRLQSAFASSLFLTNCGTFALVGYSSGHVDVFNMQSGQYKYSLAAAKTKEKGWKKANDDRAHEALVAGVAVDLLNRTAVTGAADGQIHFWHFQQHAHALRSRMRVTAGVGLFRLDPNNSLLAVGLSNGEVGVLDVLCRRLTRRLAHYGSMDWAEGAELSALEFSHDGKWLASADNRGFIKVWDLASALLIDVIRCSVPCVGLAFGECGDFLATIHHGFRGICLWANKQVFGTNAEMALKSAEELHGEATASTTRLPGVGVLAGQLDDLKVEEEEREEEEALASGSEAERHERTVVIDEDEGEEDGLAGMDGEEEGRSQAGGGPPSSAHSSFVELEQLEHGLFTLSGLAPSRWAGLPILQLIRERNRPTEAPKKAKSAPFFLPTVDTLEGFRIDGDSLGRLKEAAEEEGEEKLMKGGKRRWTGPETGRQGKWHLALMGATSGDELCELFAQLKGMSLSALDFLIRSLVGPGELAQFLAMLIAQMETRRDFELVQSYLATLLNIHCEQFWERGRRRTATAQMDGQNIGEQGAGEETEQQQKLADNLQRLLQLQKEAMDEIQPLLDQSSSLADFIKSALI